MNAPTIFEKIKSTGSQNSATLEDLAELSALMKGAAVTYELSNELAMALTEAACSIDVFLLMAGPAVERIDISISSLSAVIASETGLIIAPPGRMQ